MNANKQYESGYTLGLDLGPNSIGWALLDTVFVHVEELDKETGALVERLVPKSYTGFLDTSEAGHPPVGVRVFEAGLANFNSAKEMALNQDRREARSARRVHARRNSRRKALKGLLVQNGFLPESTEAQEEIYNLMDSNGEQINNPYRLRAKGLDEELTDYELGRAVYHFAQRRGFQSNRKSGKSQDDKGMLGEIKELDSDISASGCRTLGEYLWKIGWGPDGTSERLRKGLIRVRGRHTRRSMYKNELALLLDHQEQFHPGLADIRGDEHTPGTIEHCVFYQHPFELTEERRKRAPSRANLHRAPQVKACRLEAGERCCSKSAWIAQRFRILKEVNNIRVAEDIATGLRAAPRDLTFAERESIVELLSQQKAVKFNAIRKELAKNFGVEPNARFNLEIGGREELKGNAIDAFIANTIGKKVWEALPLDGRQDLRLALINSESDTELLGAFEEYDLNDKKLAAVLKFNPDMESGFLAFSEKALNAIVPLLEKGLNEYEAIQKAYPNRTAASAFTRKYKNGDSIPALPYLQHPDLPHELRDITNPIVRRALSEVRRVVNAIVREHGRPDQIVVELARDVKQGAEQRKATSKRNNERWKIRQDAAEAISLMKAQLSPHDQEQRTTGDDILRYMLWKEQSELCAYSGKPISQAQLMGGAVEIDHILPHWKSMDDSQLNKVLCFRKENQNKSSTLPIKWLGEGTEAYNNLLLRMMKWVEANDGDRQQKLMEYFKKMDLSIFARAQRYASLRGAWPQRLGRMLTEELDASGFTARQLNDTRYISVSVVRFLELLYPPALRIGEKAVRASRGGLTAHLRHQWGLNSVLRRDPMLNAKGKEVAYTDNSGRKQRVDHRHHAIDAVVVALSSRETLSAFQNHCERHGAFANRDELGKQKAFNDPWGSFRNDVVDAMREITVSHRVQRKVRGPFHKETFFGKSKDLSGSVKPEIYTTRKSLDQLSGKQARHIKDPMLRQVVLQRLLEKGWDGTSSALPKDWSQDELLHPNGNPIRKVRIEVRMDPEKVLALGDKGHRHAATKNNHHIVFVAIEGSNGGATTRGAVMPLVECANRVRRLGQDAVERDWSEADGEFLMSLCRKEALQVTPPGSSQVTTCVLQKMSGDSSLSQSFDIFLRDHRDSRPSTVVGRDPFARICSSKALNQWKLQKVVIDPLGRALPAND